MLQTNEPKLTSKLCKISFKYDQGVLTLMHFLPHSFDIKRPGSFWKRLKRADANGKEPIKYLQIKCST